LAQDAGQGGKPAGQGGKSAAPSPPDRLKPGEDFPGTAGELPVQWLSSIDDPQSRVEHLGYLAGFPKLPQTIRDAVEAIRKAEPDDEALALQRIWWLLRPEGS
jgi:hypothetical protein